MASVFTNTTAKLHKNRRKTAFFLKKILSDGKFNVPLHPLKNDNGPFVYRLGREIFIL